VSPTPPTLLERNRAALASVLVPSGLLRLPRERLAIESIEPAVESPAVDLRLAIAGRPLRLRFTNRDDAEPAFDRTPSFNVVHICGQGERQLDSPTTATLRWTLQRIARFDPGGLVLEQPPTAKRRGVALPVIPADAFERVWRRDLFDQAITTLVDHGKKASSAVIVITQACEMNCGFCPTTDRVNIQFRPSGEEGQFQDLCYQIARGRELGATSIDFGGNDVLRFPGIVDLFNRAGSAGYTTIIAQSPGQILADRPFAEAVANSPLTHVCLPIYGTTADVHDAVTRRKGAFDALLRALDNVRELGKTKVLLHTIALESTAKHLGDLIDFCETRLGLPLRVTNLRPNRQGERSVILDVASFTEMKPLIERYPERFRGDFPPCLFPREAEKARLRHYVFEPGQSPIHLFDLGLPAGSEDALVAQERAHDHPDRCEGCVAKASCGGVFQNYLDRFGDEELMPFK
jgi:MoaA/NifB/PqqE/SkfB family radical SAM enzyme